MTTTRDLIVEAHDSFQNQEYQKAYLILDELLESEDLSEEAEDNLYQIYVILDAYWHDPLSMPRHTIIDHFDQVLDEYDILY